MSPLFLFNNKLLVKNQSLATDISCCCGKCRCFFWKKIYNGDGTSLPGTTAPPITFTVPANIALPCKARAYGTVDDSLKIDNVYPPGEGPAVPAHAFNISWIQNNRTVDITAVDTIGANLLISITVCFTGINEPDLPDNEPAAIAQCPLTVLEGSCPYDPEKELLEC